jgi:hypothetical protein
MRSDDATWESLGPIPDKMQHQIIRVHVKVTYYSGTPSFITWKSMGLHSFIKITEIHRIHLHRNLHTRTHTHTHREGKNPYSAHWGTWVLFMLYFLFLGFLSH